MKTDVTNVNRTRSIGLMHLLLFNYYNYSPANRNSFIGSLVYDVDQHTNSDIKLNTFQGRSLLKNDVLYTFKMISTMLYVPVFVSSGILKS